MPLKGESEPSPITSVTQDHMFMYWTKRNGRRNKSQYHCQTTDTVTVELSAAGHGCVQRQGAFQLSHTCCSLVKQHGLLYAIIWYKWVKTWQERGFSNLFLHLRKLAYNPLSRWCEFHNWYLLYINFINCKIKLQTTFSRNRFCISSITREL